MEEQLVVGESPLDSRDGKNAETRDCIVQACKRVFPDTLTVIKLCGITGYAESTVRLHVRHLVSGGYLTRTVISNVPHYLYAKDMPSIYDRLVEIQTIWDDAIRKCRSKNNG